MGQGQSRKSENSVNPENPSGILKLPGSEKVEVTTGPVAPAAAGGGKRRRKRGGMSTVKWDLIPMRQPSQEVMERATTAPSSLFGGRRRSHKRRGNKKSRKVRRHCRSKRHHRKH